jgi:5'-AMP-activated protein kinase regulatory beta subunit
MGINASKDGHAGDDQVSRISAEAVIPARRRPPSSTVYDDLSARSSLAIPANDPGASMQNYDSIDSDGIVPNVFKWDHGGRHVYITGTFNNWERQIPMHRSGNDFSYVHNLKMGKHAYKFIVDDEWRFAPDQPTVADIEGRINNFIDVSEFQPYSE